MDEGINTYATARVMDEAFPEQVRGDGALLRRTRGVGVHGRARGRATIDGNRLNAFRPAASCDNPSTPTWQYWPGIGRRNHLQQDGAVAGDARAA